MLSKTRGHTLQRIIAVIGAVAFLLQGYNQSMINGLLIDAYLDLWHGSLPGSCSWAILGPIKPNFRTGSIVLLLCCTVSPSYRHVHHPVHVCIRNLALGIRYQVAGMAAASSWLFNFMVAEVTPIAIDQIYWEYYLVFASCSTVGCFAIYFLVPETQGRTLEEIDLIFLKANSIFDTVRVAREFYADPDHFKFEPDDKSGAQVAYEERL